jgi:putative hydrolase of the HAD superfamily
VSDIWSKKDLFLQEFERSEILQLFDVIVFSSDHGCVKPSSLLFGKALAAFTIDHREIVFVGDNFQRDVIGARSAGLTTVWINAAGIAHPTEHPQPDHVIRDLRELLKCGK